MCIYELTFDDEFVVADTLFLGYDLICHFGGMDWDLLSSTDLLSIYSCIYIYIYNFFWAYCINGLEPLSFTLYLSLFFFSLCFFFSLTLSRPWCVSLCNWVFPFFWLEFNSVFHSRPLKSTNQLFFFPFFLLKVVFKLKFSLSWMKLASAHTPSTSPPKNYEVFPFPFSFFFSVFSCFVFVQKGRKEIA